MNKFYLIVPAVLLAGFIVFWQSAEKDIAKKEKDKQEQAAALKAEETAHKKELDVKAEQDARKKQEERAKADREKEEKKRKEYDDAMTTLRTEIAKHSSDAASYAKEAEALSKQISDLRNKKESESRDTFELTKQVELAKINRRTSEMEIQRTYEMVAKRFSDSGWANPPPPAPAAPTK